MAGPWPGECRKAGKRRLYVPAKGLSILGDGGGQEKGTAHGSEGQGKNHEKAPPAHMKRGRR